MSSTPRRVELSPAALSALREVSTATLTSQLLRRGFRSTFLAGLVPQRPDLRMVGYAFTLRYVPSREDLGFQVDMQAMDFQTFATRRLNTKPVSEGGWNLAHTTTPCRTRAIRSAIPSW